MMAVVAILVPVMAIVAVTVAICFAFYGFFLDAFVNLFTMHAYFARGFHAKSDLIAFNTQYRYINIVTDDYGFSDSSSQDKHKATPPFLVIICVLAEAHHHQK